MCKYGHAICPGDHGWEDIKPMDKAGCLSIYHIIGIDKV